MTAYPCLFSKPRRFNRAQLKKVRGMGNNIALTGMTVLLFLVLLAHITRGVDLNTKLASFLGLLTVVSFVSIPVGIIINIWLG